jgi:hypothetical protein
LTQEELSALKQGLIMSGRIHQAISLLEEMMKQAELEDKQTSVTALREEIERLKLQEQNSLSLSSPLMPDGEEKNDQRMGMGSEETKGPQSSTFTELESEQDEEIMSYTSTPTVSTVQMSHLSDILTVQINDVEVCSFFLF